jgi:hypothetical protein
MRLAPSLIAAQDGGTSLVGPPSLLKMLAPEDYKPPVQVAPRLCRLSRLRRQAHKTTHCRADFTPTWDFLCAVVVVTAGRTQVPAKPPCRSSPPYRRQRLHSLQFKFQHKFTPRAAGLRIHLPNGSSAWGAKEAASNLPLPPQILGDGEQLCLKLSTTK